MAASVADVASHYDELDAFYRRMWGEHVHHGLWETGRETKDEAVVRLLERIAERSNLEAGATVCDVGCGYGATARWLADRFDASVVGYTVSAAQHAYAIRLCRDATGAAASIRYRLADWLENDEPDASFDSVVAIESTEHMDSRRRASEEAYRVLRPGGRFAVAAWLSSPHPRPWQVRHLLEPIWREGALAGALPTEAEWQATLADAGFTAIGAELLGPAVRRTWTLIARGILRELMRSKNAWSYLLDARNRHRRFALTVFRILIAFQVGAMDYAVIVAQKPLAGARSA